MKMKRTKIALLCMVSAFSITACHFYKDNGTVMSPPLIPNASYVGEATCKACHASEHKYFHLTHHANVSISMENDDGEIIHAESCETCHGPGSLHVEGMGDKSKIILASPETCFGCHLDIKGKFQLQFHHPVPEGRMICSDCHSSHGNTGSALGKVALEEQNETCFKCHKAQRGPFAFEHEAVREGCTVCHNPHGSINDRLLVAGPSTLCLSCHFEAAVNDSCRIGGSGHSHRPVSVEESCLDCHTLIHGSNNTRSSLRD